MSQDQTAPAGVSPGAGPFDGSAVIVVNYGSSSLLAENLTVLTRAAPGIVAVVVDNYTDPLERENLRHLAAAEGWHVDEPPINLGFGVGMNRGVEAARALGASRYLLLNPDAIIEVDAAAALFERVRETPNALVAPKILRPDGTVWFAGSDLYLDDGRIRSRRRRLDGVPLERIEPWLTGACLAVSQELWEATGGFSDDYFLYWEDVDLSHRVVATGGELVLLDEVTAEHAQGGTQAAGHSSAGEPKSATYYYYNIRNRLLFAALHLEDADYRSWLSHSRAVAWEILLQGGRRQLLQSTAPLGAALRGLRDGRRLARRARRARHAG
ncbi:glycosyltransferase family 2 protein [Labedella endophytica]|uniref:Glycosyltransferase family 2 protein n=1 Tax=Labedella endophytica TaxID=1523160 RepID=A0A433JW95_9MICO|nr:glycosyltransferase family 2 protein [Labedella endophytica]RUR03472.1 glycosyltransferase family 2 protein [Labedella endophytica]